ncbi:MAG: peptidoglycan-binding domain-containing protein [Pseudomonadota bacterium]
MKSALAVVFLSSTLIASGPAVAGGKNFLKGVAVGAGAVILGKHLLDKRKKKKRKLSSKRSKTYSTQPDHSREQVKSDQSALAALGYYSGKIDGIPGRGTRAAVSGFQRDHGLAVTGNLTSGDRQQLYQSANNGSTFTQQTGQTTATFASSVPDSNGEVDVFGGTASEEAVADFPAEGQTNLASGFGAQESVGAGGQLEADTTVEASIDEDELQSIFDTDAESAQESELAAQTN